MKVGSLFSSNSSMVDSNSKQNNPSSKQYGVQIPLWSIVTLNKNLYPYLAGPFKFLYGR